MTASVEWVVTSSSCLSTAPPWMQGPNWWPRDCSSVLREPFTVEGSPNGPLTLTASIGIAAGIRPSPTELLRDADIALYQAKAAGRDCFVVFRPQMHTAVQDRLLLEMDLRDGAGSGPILPRSISRSSIWPVGRRTASRRCLRWRHPVRGVVQPDEFIPILEGSGMINDVGRWVLEEACRQGARWHVQGYHLDVSVNVSARQLETERLIEDVAHALEKSGFDPHSLIVEITETAIMKNMDAVVPDSQRSRPPESVSPSTISVPGTPPWPTFSISRSIP